MRRAFAVYALAVTAASAANVDLMQSIYWTKDPVLGAPSVQTWERFPCNPIYRGAAPYEWPVNGSLFADPASGNWYAYIGRYPKNYEMHADAPMHCEILRSKDRGASWEDLGRMFPVDTPHVYAGETSPIEHAPDVMVIYADGRYHACFDWVTANTTWQNITAPGPECNNGVGYAWAEHPEGPWHITERPIATTRGMKLLCGKYRRLYCSSIVRRKKDWLVLTTVDSGAYFGWGLVGMTAKYPEGPYSEPKLLLSCEGDEYYPPLFEFFPAHIGTDGRLQVPGTSVAKNRAVQALFSIDPEKVFKKRAWCFESLQALLQPTTNEYEHDGIWGQTYSLIHSGPEEDTILYPSRDAAGFGTINLASRNKNQWGPLTIGGQRGAALSVYPLGDSLRELHAYLRVHGTISILWGHTGPLGPDAVASDASIHPLLCTGCASLELREDGHWRLARAELGGEEDTLQSGSFASGLGFDNVMVDLQFNDDGNGLLRINGRSIFEGEIPNPVGNLAVLARPHSAAEFHTSSLETHADRRREARLTWLPSAGLLGAAQAVRADTWLESTDLPFRFGKGYISASPEVRAKWNVRGDRIVVWSPRGPELGKADVLIDGRRVATINQYARSNETSRVVYDSGTLKFAHHAVVLRPRSGSIAIDAIEVGWNPERTQR